MDKFIFEGYEFDEALQVASFHYSFPAGLRFEEKVQFAKPTPGYDKELLKKALFLSFILVGISYYKTFPTLEMEIRHGAIDEWQKGFFDRVYQEGLSQFAFENNLTRDDLAHFKAAGSPLAGGEGSNQGVIALQSGGKDSLLMAILLEQKHHSFIPWHVSNAPSHPTLLDTLGSPLRVARRFIDQAMLTQARAQGGLNGHVPVTYMIASFALIDAILQGANTILLAIGHEGEEPHDWIGDLPVMHQWSKTWPAEKAFAEYVKRYISPDITIGSPLRGYSELRIAELFVKYGWQRYGHQFSSCNLANYMQGQTNTTLQWCGECPKCANSFLLFAPFLPSEELKSLFAHQDLFTKNSLQKTFKGLLGIDGVMKPLECVGEIEELRLAYHMAQSKGGYGQLSFVVPASKFNYHQQYPAQAWAQQMIQ